MRETVAAERPPENLAHFDVGMRDRKEAIDAPAHGFSHYATGAFQLLRSWAPDLKNHLSVPARRAVATVMTGRRNRAHDLLMNERRALTTSPKQSIVECWGSVDFPTFKQRNVLIPRAELMVCEIMPRHNDAEKTLDVHTVPWFRHTPISYGLAHETLTLYTFCRQYAF